MFEKVYESQCLTNLDENLEKPLSVSAVKFEPEPEKNIGLHSPQFQGVLNAAEEFSKVSKQK